MLRLAIELNVQEMRARSRVEEVLLLVLGLVVLFAVSLRGIYLGIQKLMTSLHSRSSSAACFVGVGDGPVVDLFDVLRSRFSSRKTRLNDEKEVEGGAEVIDLVEQRLAHMKLGNMCCLMQIFGVALLPFTLQVLLNVAQGGYLALLTPLQQILLLAAQSFCALAVVRPACVAAAGLDVCFVCLAIPAILFANPIACCHLEGASACFGHASTAMATLNIIRGLWTSWREVVLSLLCNAAYLTSWIVGLRLVWGTHTDQSIYESIAHQLALHLGLKFLASLFEAHVHRTLHRGLQLEEVQEMYNAACALLRSCYDVVVELDSVGRLEGGLQELGSLLLRRDGQRAMRGTSLADLILDEAEREHFLRRLADPKMKTVGLAESMQVSMKDATGGVLRLEMMWFDFKRADGVQHVMIGIRELSDQSSLDVLAHGGLIRPSESAGVDSLVPASEEVSECSSQEGDPPVSSADEEDALAVVDTLRDGCPIRGVSRGFRTSIGHVPRNAPLSRITRSHQEMSEWLGVAVNSVMHGMDQPRCSVALVMPQGKIRVECSIVEDPKSADLDFANILVRFRIHRTRPGSRKRASRQGSPSSQQPSGSLVGKRLMRL